ncbi:MAG: phosphohistidine phosphatase SixA [Porticoccaceae bacterium]
MKLYLLRHGDAAANAPSDAERPLTRRGEGEVLEIAQRCTDRLKQVAQVVSSPYLRARQTAAILTRTLSDVSGYQGELLINPLITPAGQLDEVGAFVGALESEEVLLVTHQPLVGYLLNYLTDSDAHGGMTTANLAALELSAFTRGGAKLLWLERPTH